MLLCVVSGRRKIGSESGFSGLLISTRLNVCKELRKEDRLFRVIVVAVICTCSRCIIGVIMGVDGINVVVVVVVVFSIDRCWRGRSRVRG